MKDLVIVNLERENAQLEADNFRLTNDLRQAREELAALRLVIAEQQSAAGYQLPYLGGRP